ncbi:MAG: Gfo/Idh/MocA family protein [Erysipelotrichaceae bacterium]|jgi:predicted dehydrogenase
MINIGIVGSGFIVPIFIEAVNNVGGYHIRGIMARKAEVLSALKEKYSIDYYTLDYKEMFDDPEIDAIYLGVPNSDHYFYAKEALSAGKHVIVEKPFCHKYKHAKEIVNLAKEKNLIVYEAITNQSLPNYQKIKELLPEIGDIKLLDINFSQYSSRYDKFKNGITLPAFDFKKAGGSLMDIGVYNIHFVAGLFGKPEKVHYFANIENGIDTSGVLIMSYPTFEAVCISAKDCKAPLHVLIQGDKAFIQSNGSSSLLDNVIYKLNKEDGVEYKLNKEDGYFYEFNEFKQLVKNNDLEAAQKLNKHTLLVNGILEEALATAGIIFED